MTLEMECTYDGSENATFWLAAAEDRSVQPTLTPTPSNTATVTPTFMPSATATATITPTTSITPTPSATPTPSDTPIYLGRVFDSAVGASADDSYAYQQYGRWRNAATEDDTVLEYTNVGGLRFANVEIPAGARIDAAYVEVHVYHSDDPRLYLFAEAAADAADFSARRPDLSGRGEAFARWEGDDIGEAWRRSPDIGSLIQETVDRPGWESGNAFALLMQPAGGRFRFRQWDYGEGEYAARLHVEYSLAATATPTATPELREVVIDYQYDPLNRLIGADYSTGERFYYAYDAVGNRLRQETHEGSNVYVYDAANRLVEVDGVPYAWSANGNLLDDGERTYTYDHAGRLSSLVVGQQSYTFSYNGLGDRLLQSVSGVPTQYTLDLNAGLTQVLADGTNAYLYGLSRIGQQGADGWAYHLPDALVPVRQMADPAASATLAQSYEPYGNVLDVSGESRTPYGFAGEWMDRTGLVHLRARYHAPYFGAFVQPDPWAGEPNIPSTFHKYLYALNNPVINVGPSGQGVCLYGIDPAT